MNTTAFITLTVVFLGCVGMLWLARFLNKRDRNK